MNTRILTPADLKFSTESFSATHLILSFGLKDSEFFDGKMVVRCDEWEHRRPAVEERAVIHLQDTFNKTLEIIEPFIA